ncbi:MAG: Streptomyces cyclase/dehydrase, partial [uncultured Blastococcus sp.]
GQRAGVRGRRRTDPGRLRPVDPVRVLPPVHGRGRAHHPARRHPHPLGHQHRRRQARVRRRDHRAASRGARRLDEHQRRGQARRGGHLPPAGRRQDPRDDPDRLGAPRAGREGRGRPGIRRPPGEGGRQEVQGVHREPGHRDRRLARGRRASQL